MFRGKFLVILLVFLGPALNFGCAGADLRDNQDFVDLHKQVERTELDHSAQLASLRHDVMELQVKTGVSKTSPNAAAKAGGGLAVVSAQMEILYRQGRDLYLKNDFEGAAKVFRQMLSQSPRDKLAPNARYWLGECHYSRRQFREAIAEFEQVVRDYPASEKAPDATLKIAYSLHLLGDGAGAMENLRTLLNKYPTSHAATMVKKGQTLFRNP
ncbi:MAG: tol-pal system protein YbgF [Thermodesulfobacteriota bacterium]